MVRRFLSFLIAAGSLFAEHVYIGTASKGIYIADFDSKTGKLGAPSIVPTRRLPATFRFIPTAAICTRSTNTKEESSSSFSIESGSGKLTPINSVSVKSSGPCYIAIDKAGHWAITANYSGGSVTVLPIESGGRLGEPTEFIQHKGSGPNRDRQTAPHPHWVGFIPKSNLVLVTDLGIDTIAIYNFDNKKGTLTVGNPAFMTIPPGSGPRHAVMHPNGKFFYVNTELTSLITEYYFEAEMKRFTADQYCSTLPEGFKGENTGAEIAMDPKGKYVYASNRGDDSIVVFSVSDLKKGTLKLEQHIPSGGKTPRQFEIDPTGHWLLAGNQGSDNIAIFSIDASTGKLTASGVVTGVPKPTCIKFAK